MCYFWQKKKTKSGQSPGFIIAVVNLKKIFFDVLSSSPAKFQIPPFYLRRKSVSPFYYLLFPKVAGNCY